MNRAEHLAWAKKRALEYVDMGDLLNAVVSLSSDLLKHEDFRTAGVELALQFGLFKVSHGAGAVRHWIEGFN